MNLRLLIIFILFGYSNCSLFCCFRRKIRYKGSNSDSFHPGDGLSSPLQGMTVTIEAIVTGDFQGRKSWMDSLFKKRIAMLTARTKPQKASLFMIQTVGQKEEYLKGTWY